MLTLRRFNNTATIVVIALGLYIVILPFLPEVIYRARLVNKPADGGAPYSGQLAGSDDDRKNPPADNRIVIPSLQLDEPVKTGTNIGVLNDGGTWLRPKTSAPDQQGNTVIVGHRYYQRNLSTFYNLDKLKVGERIGVYWEGKEYVYKITEIKVVPSDAGYIEDKTNEKQLTLYTCTPIWTAKDRLVVVAKYEELTQ